MRALLGLLILAGCEGEAEEVPDSGPPLCEQLQACHPVGDAPSLSEPITVAPSEDLPPEFLSQTSHNNLDIVWHGERLFVAIRTAPSHFASEDTWLYVVSTTDHRSWRYEGGFHVGRDLREPRFGSVKGRLFLYFAILGTDRFAFEPGETRVTEYKGPEDWTEPELIFEETFIPWRIKVIDEVAYMLGYVGGEGVYDPTSDPIRVHFLRSEDGLAWSPVVEGRSVVWEGGVSEADFVFRADGSLVAVGRNEAGEGGVFGSKICTAPADALAEWTCADDPKKYDSPLVFSHGEEVWLVGRRNVTDTGHYDLMESELTPERQWAANQAGYWMKPKRCALWRVRPESLSVEHVLDLPSAGDTCFASVLPVGPGQYLLYNYSSPYDQGDITWLQGQNGPTHIYRVTLSLE